ncbi:hypothetical protein M011DRAFT_481558 [Sporormia fimetaria CBS 119925]|uniref:GPI anchored protein n=1 Tax=Sporormia fimetaria CBS 119925 TaxID=1340428 RepID=A0A6A6UY46_9PLEO|nr:hypothetical protein M011DRAFT_481558 [Sporormia fimetaria CBS 119925]
MFPLLVLSAFWGAAYAQSSARDPNLFSNYLRVCYGEDSVCEIAVDMRDECEQNAGSLSSPEYYKCVCEGGSVPVEQACQDCALFYSRLGTGFASMLSSQCSSRSFTVAPMPESVVSIQEARNATIDSTGGMDFTTDLPTLPTDIRDAISDLFPDTTFISSLNGMFTNLPKETAPRFGPTDGPFAGGETGNAASKFMLLGNVWTISAVSVGLMAVHGFM